MAYQHFFGQVETIPPLLSDDMSYRYVVMAACYHSITKDKVMLLHLSYRHNIRANAVTSKISKRDGYENNSLNSETTPKTLGAQ